MTHQPFTGGGCTKETGTLSLHKRSCMLQVNIGLVLWVVCFSSGTLGSSPHAPASAGQALTQCTGGGTSRRRAGRNGEAEDVELHDEVSGELVDVLEDAVPLRSGHAGRQLRRIAL